MSKRLGWILDFLGVTTAALAMEIGAAIKDSEDTPTWTDLIIEHIHWEVFAVIYGGFVIWAGLHFGVRYVAKYRARPSETPPQTGPPPTA